MSGTEDGDTRRHAEWRALRQASRAARAAAGADPAGADPAGADPAAPPALKPARALRAVQRQARRALADAAAPTGPLTPEEVIAAYRWILGRVPESEEVITRCIERSASAETLRGRLLRSAELRSTGLGLPEPGPPRDAGPLAIDLEAGLPEIEEMLRGVQRVWTRLGEAAPHHSVLSEDRFLPEAIEANRRAFLATGIEDREIVEGALARAGLAPGAVGRLVEFGCGVGRATLHLAALAPEVAGVDISPAHLEVARQEALGRGLDHIRWLRAHPDRPMPVERCDLLFSRRALQWNPPPVIRQLLWLGFGAVAPGGLAVVQLVTHGFGYGFSLAGRLAALPPEAPEMHALPQAEVFALAAAAGLETLEVQEDPVPGLDRRRWVSHLFVARRPG